MADEATTTEDQAKEVRIVAPKSAADIQALPALKTTEASDSLSRFINENINVEGFEITSEQAWALLYCHPVWQKSDERKAEKEAVTAAKAEAAEKRKQEREAKKAEREKLAAEKKAERERKAAEKAANEAEEGEDLEAADTEGEDKIPARKRRSRKPKADEVADAPADADEAPAEADGF